MVPLFKPDFDLGCQETRTENNGNLILEDIPLIPQSIKDDLSKFQNVRSADLEVLTMTMESYYHKIWKCQSAPFCKSPELHDNKLLFSRAFGSISTNPNNSSIAFTMDKGGTENAQIYLLDTDNGESKLLTDGSQEMAVPYGVIMET